MKRDEYLNAFLNENENENLDNIDFQKEFMDVGVSVEKDMGEKDVDEKEFDMGMDVEMEHTTNEDVAKKIALDHLAEIPDYYTRLAKMEKEAFDEYGESEALEEKKKNRKKKRKKNSLRRGFVGGYGYGCCGTDSDGDVGDGGGDGGGGE